MANRTTLKRGATDLAARAVAGRTLRAVDYLRVSTEEQRKGYGVASQGRKTARYIATKQWEHVDTYVDDGVSGSLAAEDRPRLKQLMADAHDGAFDVVVVKVTIVPSSGGSGHSKTSAFSSPSRKTTSTTPRPAAARKCGAKRTTPKPSGKRSASVHRAGSRRRRKIRTPLTSGAGLPMATGLKIRAKSGFHTWSSIRRKPQ
ncbi:recombinase family protein [Streptomyces sp. YGL11-2]|uniref:recombinase family protein n=1 Tax=Streptomyces sp. YGL11-2 TaxID=3414028 RepID=UPI003CF333ED